MSRMSNGKSYGGQENSEVWRGHWGQEKLAKTGY